MRMNESEKKFNEHTAAFRAARAAHEADRGASTALARKVGKALAKSSIPKATAYKSFAGRDVDGYEVHAGRVGVRAYVFTTKRGQVGVDETRAIFEVLTAAGFEVSEPKDPTNGHVPSLDVAGERAR